MWEATLSAIRDELQLAFVSMNYMHFPPSIRKPPGDDNVHHAMGSGMDYGVAAFGVDHSGI
ncbi:MAG: hypothetical protein R3D29_11275 [Nitratireductor sp.]